MKNAFSVGDIVRPVSKNDAFEISCGFVTPSHITINTEFEIAVVVERARTSNGEIESGLIIAPFGDRSELGYLPPYIW